MKRLFLLRHAETASSSEDGSDRLRPLTSKGQEDARALGLEIKTRALIPDLVYCSVATRTKQTLACLEDTLEDLSVIELETLYNGSCGDLFAAIQDSSEDVETLMIVAHNPGIHELAGRLTGDGDPALLEKLLFGYPPGSLSVIACPCEKWTDIQLGDNQLTALLSPSDYN